jgi:topoisomerase IA-like protein
LPKEFQTIEYEGSRPLGSQFGDIMYSGLSIAVTPGPFGIHLPQDANIQLPKDDDPTT